jgi:hypothetical protein
MADREKVDIVDENLDRLDALVTAWKDENVKKGWEPV